MSKSIFLPTLFLAVCMLLLSLALPGLSSADQVETIPESSPQTGDGSAKRSVDPLTSLFQGLRGLIGRADDKPAVAAEQAPVEMVSENTPPEKPAIAVTTEPVVNAEEQNRSAAGKAAVEKAERDRIVQEKAAEEQKALGQTERDRLAAEKAELLRITEEKAIREKIAAERAEQNRAAAIKVATEQAKLESGVMTEEKAPDKPESVRTLTPNVPATIAKQKAGSPPSSSWNSLLALVGLHDDRRSIPPQELQNTSSPLGQDYIIGPGDVIGISVWRDEALTRSAVVLPDGKIQFPLIGEIVAGGKTVLQLKQEFVEKLSKYVVDADISVDVKQSNSLVIYIIGKVNNPGRQILLANTSVLQALSMAGGLNLFADKDDIKIFRQDNDRTVVYSFRYSKVVSGTYLDDNIMLKRGDVIVVP